MSGHGGARTARKIICSIAGHRRDSRRPACARCGVTDLELHERDRPAPTHQDVTDAYWRGVRDGRKVDRKRAYRTGYMRGGRSVFAVVEMKLLGDGDDASPVVEEQE